MFDDVVFLGDSDIASLVTIGDAVDVLEHTYREVAAGTAHPLLRTQVRWDDGRMQALGGHLEGLQCAGVKQWTVTPQGAQPTIVLFSSVDGRVVAILEASQLGRIRTGATSGLATRYMAAADASVLLVIGTGRQALTQVAAVLHVRDITEVLVAGRNATKADAFAVELQERFAVSARAVATVAEAAAQADIITAVTNAIEPVLLLDMIGPGTHVNAVGAAVPHAAEVDPALLGAADAVAADSVTQVLADSREIRDAIDAHGLTPDEITGLDRIVSGEVRATGDLTVFKSLGLGLADVALAELAWRRAAP